MSILIDGANFYLLSLNKLGIKDADFDFEAFVAFLTSDRKIGPHGKRYYIGTVSERQGDEKSRVAMSRQTSLFTRLRNAGWEIKTSKHRRREEEIIIDSRVKDWQELIKKGVERVCIERYREKGIDVKMATDLIVGAVDDQYDTAIIVSSDTDLIPAIDWVRNRFKKKIEYVGFSIPDAKNPQKNIKPTSAMIQRTDTQRVLVESDLRKLLVPKLPLR